MFKKQPARQQNIDAIVSYIEGGFKEKAETIGIELEHTLVHSDGSAVSYDEEFGQKWLLEQLKSDYPQETFGEEDALIGLAETPKPGKHLDTVTLEPAAQLELSAGPFHSLAVAKECFEEFERKVESILSPHDIDVLAVGYHPTMRAIDLKLIPKKRYEIMNEYLGAISMFGICMMRGSAAAQVSIDFTNAEDCTRKMRLANACVPVFSLMTDNSAVFEGEIRPHQLVRTEIWEKCDPKRCGTIPGVMDRDFALSDYAEYILDTPAMVAVENGEQVLSETTFGEIFANNPMKRDDVEHALSTFFNDVRLKTYIEIRPADAMPVSFTIAYGALIKGLFYDEGALESMERLFAGVGPEDILAAKHSLMENGYNSNVYGYPVSEIADELISVASTSLDDESLALLEPLARIVSQRTTLADMTLS